MIYLFWSSVVTTLKFWLSGDRSVRRQAFANLNAKSSQCESHNFFKRIAKIYPFSDEKKSNSSCLQHFSGSLRILHKVTSPQGSLITSIKFLHLLVANCWLQLDNFLSNSSTTVNNLHFRLLDVDVQSPCNTRLSVCLCAHSIILSTDFDWGSWMNSFKLCHTVTNVGIFSAKLVFLSVRCSSSFLNFYKQNKFSENFARKTSHWLNIFPKFYT